MSLELLTEKDAQVVLQVSRTTLWRLRRDGALPHLRVGGEVRYQRTDLERWLRAQRESAAKADSMASRPLPIDSCQSAREEAWCKSIAEQDWAFHHHPTTEHTHGLHPYPAKFPPPLPARLIEILTRKGQTVLDPFCGSGTTLVEAVRLDRAAVGVDVNPIGVLSSMAKTIGLSEAELNALSELRRAIEGDSEIEAGEASLFASGTIPVDPVEPPPIPNIENWFEPVAARELGIALRRANELASAPKTVAHAALSAILVSVSNQDSETRYAARPKSLMPGEVLARYARRLGEVAAMHSAWSATRTTRRCRVLLSDARTLAPRAVGRVHAVITSPPYANAFDYHLYHRHRMYWLGYDPASVRDVEIGSHLNHQREKDGVAAYRDDMAAVMSSLSRSVQMGTPCAFVVGDSVFNGLPVSNAHVLIDVGREAGFRCIATAERSIHPIKRSMIGPARRARIERILLFVRST